MKVVLRILTTIACVLGLSVHERSTAHANDSTVTVMAFGDSYTAGNGSSPSFGGYGECNRSTNAYVHKYAEKIRQAGISAVSKNYACGGAKIADVYKQLDDAGAELGSADIITFSIGGNDAGFSFIVAACLEPIPSWADYLVDLANPVDNPFTGLLPSFDEPICDTLLGIAREKIDSIIASTEALIKEISRRAPRAQLVFVGYPFLIEYQCSSNGDQVRKLQSAWSGFAEASIIRLEQSGAISNGRFLSLYQAFKGGGICASSTKLINDLDPLDPTGSFHPNQQGHQVIADELFALNTHELFRSAPPADPVYTSPPPATGTGSYPGLPFDCGTVVPYVSTYDSYGGVNHGYSLDMPMPSNTRVVSPVDGQVFTHSDPYGYGNFIDLSGVDGVVHRFAHLSKFNVSHGQSVKRGAVIGLVGSTGFSTGPHLHYEQRKGSSQVPINLGGPALQWGGDQDSSGFRTTTHGLVSGNCTGTGWNSSAGTTSGGISDRYADIFTHEYGNMRYGRSDGYDYRNWEVGLPNITNPHDSDTCDFDGDGWDEYLSYEKLSGSVSRVMMANPVGDGRFTWSKIANVLSDVDAITCGDWNKDGKDDLFLHNKKGQIVYARSHGTKAESARRSIVLRGIGKPTYWDMCDINGDGRDDIVSYEAWGNQLMYGVKNSGSATARWGFLLKGIYGVGGLTCDNFQNYTGDELVVWQPEDNGRYMIGVFNRYFQRIHWDALSPRGIGKPYKGELVSGDIDGDGYAEFVSNEYRSATKNHSVMVGDFTSTRGRRFTWHPFIEGIRPTDLGVGKFVG